MKILALLVGIALTATFTVQPVIAKRFSDGGNFAAPGIDGGRKEGGDYAECFPADSARCDEFVTSCDNDDCGVGSVEGSGVSCSCPDGKIAPRVPDKFRSPQ
ncbi:hypothetical protein [Thiothrix nivea]|uniref:hypothetical protein n=1 Tax=Thiothrix nivea TaxID=1031 RepID=UPI0012B6A1D2|nr:hypothetical protein [Thiothrix nivea]